ncbi:MAG TPA: PAS domain-containing protein [Candidatus Binatia bacterium]
MKLRSYLVGLGVAAVLPVVIFAGVMTYRSYLHQQQELAQQMIERARAISAALDREFLVSIQSLKVLGASTNLKKGNLAEFYVDMNGALTAYRRAWQNLTLTDSSGQQLINLRRPFGASLPTSGNPEAIERVRQTREPWIANLSPGPVTGAPGIVVHVPVLNDGEITYVLNAIFYPAPLTELLMQQKLPPSWFATIIDGNQIIVARTRNFDQFFGRPATPTFAAQARNYQESTWRGATLDGDEVFAALHRSHFTGWTVGLAITAEEFDGLLRNSLVMTGAGGLALLLMALALAAALGRRIAEPVSALSQAAEKLGRGETPPLLPSRIFEVHRVARAMADAGKKRHEAEAALRKSEANLAAAETRAKLGSWEIDVAAQTAWWSAEMFRLFDRDPVRGAPTLAEFLDMVHPEDRGGVEETQTRTIRTGGDHSVDFRRVPAGVAERHFSAILRATKNATGGVVQLAGTVQDVTERKLNEARIQHLNRVYAVLSDINQAIVRIRDPQTLLSSACRIAVEKGDFRLAWIGRLNAESSTIEPIAQAGFSDGYVEQLTIIPGDGLHDPGPTTRALRERRAMVCNDIEHDPRTAPWRDEALRRGYRSSAAFPLKIGNEMFGAFNLYSGERGFFNAAELSLLDELAADIGLALEIQRNESERLRAENSLRESEERFRQLAENIGEVFWLSTPDKSRMIYVSPGYQKIWGRSCQSLYDSPRDWLAAIHPDDRDPVIEAALRDQETGTYDQEYRIVRPDGTIRWIRDRAFPVQDSRGTIYRIAGIAEDITGSKEVKSALKRSQEQLEERVNERTRELREANIKLRELDGLKSQFLANMSHELRTPLNAIIGFSQLMHDEKAGGPASAEQKEYLRDILNSATHLLQLINDVLDMSKVEAGRMEILRSNFRLEEVVIEVVHNIAPIMSVKGLRLVREIPADLPPITTDRRKLLQILLNLASNAVKFTEEGRIGIRCEAATDKFRLSVWDTGIGIKPEELEFLFQPFSQLDGSLRKRHEGTGLGLYLSKKLASLLGGDLTAASEYSQGSTFTLTIPLVAEDSNNRA